MVAHPDDPERYSLIGDLAVILFLLALTASALGAVAYGAWSIVGEAGSRLQELVETETRDAPSADADAPEENLVERLLRGEPARRPVDWVTVALDRSRLRRGKVVLRGEATNREPSVAYDIEIEVIALDREGTTLATATVKLTEPIAPNQTRRFTAPAMTVPKRPARLEVQVVAFDRPLE